MGWEWDRPGSGGDSRGWVGWRSGFCKNWDWWGGVGWNVAEDMGLAIKAKQCKVKQCKAKQSRAKQSKQSKAKQSRAKQSKAREKQQLL